MSAAVMVQIDFVGGLPAPLVIDRKPRKPRKSVQDQKDALIAELKALTSKCPPGVVNGSVQETRRWQAARRDAVKLISNSRASVNQLSAAVNSMAAFK